MTWLGRFGWIFMAIATLAIALAVFCGRLPEPKPALVVDHARLFLNGEPGKELTLPQVLMPRHLPDNVRYVATFDLAKIPATRLFLLIPSLNCPVSLMLNDGPLYDSEARALWSGPLLSTSAFVELPAASLHAGRNELTVTIETDRFIMPISLSKLYIGSESALEPVFKLRVFLDDRLKSMALAAQVLLGLGIIFAYFCRPKEPLLAWLAAIVAVSSILSLAFFAGFQPALSALLPLATSLLPVMSLLVIGVAFTLAELRMPGILKVIAFGMSAICIVLVHIVGAEFKMMMVLTEILATIAAFVVATGIAGWAAVRRRNVDARLLVPPLFLFVCFVIRDLAVALGIYNRSMLVTPYARTVILAAVILMLMRRLASTLSDLDSSNEILNARLAAREAELVELHRAERAEAAHLVREEERRRLTRDLHDGISGHLASIIAMAERPDSDLKPIEEAAREALDDLRLVIYSLDLGDRELPLALASFRERLIPQLRRLGVRLDWSTADLPEVSGVTPGNALAILRILQETITNAIKHGPASMITVRGSAVPGGRVAIVVENDGRPFAPGKGGLGMENMRQRARHLHGAMQVRSLDHGVSVTLLLPSHLPDFHVDPAPGEYRAADPTGGAEGTPSTSHERGMALPA